MKDIFPFLKKGLIYLDSAATSLKPQSVIDRESDYYFEYGVNTGRGTSLHNFNSTNWVESVRKRVADFIGAESSSEIVFTYNCSESINMVANNYIRKIITPGSNIVVTQLEHHSNYVPWLKVAEERGCEFRVIPLNNNRIDYSCINEYIDENTVITAVTGMSNVTGEVTELDSFIKRCRETGSKILVDAAQMIVHKKIDLSLMDVDFLAFSAHKLYGPFGLGFLYGRDKLLECFTPDRFGGNMVSYISDLRDVSYREVPRRLECGTRNSAAIYAFDSVLDFLNEYSIDEWEKVVYPLSEYLIKRLNECEGVVLYSGPGSIISFNIKGIHPHDASEFFDRRGIILRCGNLCASPFFTGRSESGVIRVSLGLYNTREEVDILIEAVKDAKEFFL